MAEDVNALYASTLERAKNVRKGVEQVVEIPFWLYPDKPKWVSGIRPHTTCRDILLSLVRSDPNKIFTDVDVLERRLVLVEQWRGVEKPLSPISTILKIWNAWGEERKQVRFIVKVVSSSSTKYLDLSKPDSSKRCPETSKSCSASVEPSRRKIRRRRNSVSSVGSFADEPHPRRIAKMSENRVSEMSDSPAKRNEMVENTKRFAEMTENFRQIEKLAEKSKPNGDVFDEHIDEMMKIIVLQGRKICEELQKFKDTSSSSRDRKSRRRRAKENPSPGDAKIVTDSSHNTSRDESASENFVDVKITSDGDDSSRVDISQRDDSKESQNHSILSPVTGDNENRSSVTSTEQKCDNHTSKKGRMLPKIPLNAKIFDISKSLKDISTCDTLNTSRDSSNVSLREQQSDSSDSGVLKKSLGKRANSSLDMSRTSMRIPALTSDSTLGQRNLGQRSNTSLELSRNSVTQLAPSQRLLNSSSEIGRHDISDPSLSRSTIDLSETDTSKPSMDPFYEKLELYQLVRHLNAFSYELTNLAQVNDKLQFAEESIDRLHIALSHQHQQNQKSASTPNLEASNEHLHGARSEVEKLRVINENVGREIAENQKQLHSLDEIVKAKRSVLKHLEYDVNVIEKEGRKLARELEKVMNIKIESFFEDDIRHIDEEASTDKEIGVIVESGVSETGKMVSETLDVAGRTSTTGTPESSTSGNSSGSNSEKSVRFCLEPTSVSATGKCLNKSGVKSREHSGDGDSNSDTGLSSLHSSSDEGTYEIGTLV